MQREFDKSCKALFSHPAIIEHLLSGIFPEDFLIKLELESLTPMSTEFITSTMQERRADKIWKIRWQGEWFHMIILLEFQSTVETFMIHRVMNYISLVYDHIINQDKEVQIYKQLPPILPIVLYSGKAAWTAPVSFSGLLPKVPDILLEYQPNLKYWLLDLGRCRIEEWDDGNLIKVLIALEQSQNKDSLSNALINMDFILKSPSLSNLRATFIKYLEWGLVSRVSALKSEIQTGEIGEVHQMFDRFAETMLEQGKLEGKLEGKHEGELTLLKLYLSARFGVLSPACEKFLESRTIDELSKIAVRLFEVNSLEKVLTPYFLAKLLHDSDSLR